MASTVLPNGIIIPEKYSRDWYNDLYHNWQELDNLLSASPGNGTLTIQKNGTTVGTFSANQATDETINISVPTKTSDLTNDSNFVPSTDLATVATSGSYNDLSNKPTIPTKTSDLNNDSGFITEDTTKIPLAGSNAISGDLIPSTNGTVNLGGSSYQWNNAYIKSLTINGVICGDILTHNVSEFVNVTGAQTIGGVKTFTSPIGIVKGSGDVELSIKNTSLSLKANTNSGMDDIRFVDKDNLIVGGLRQSFTNSKVIGMTYSRSYSSDGNSYTQAEFTLATDNQNGISDAYVKCDNFYPNANATINLGTSTNKWKTINGINPGALSLPSSTVSMNLIGDVSVVGTEKKLSKDITVTGYIYVDVSFTSSNRLNLYNDTKKYGIWMPCNSGGIRQIMPISAGDRLEFNVLDAGSTVNAIQLFACQGNV